MGTGPDAKINFGDYGVYQGLDRGRCRCLHPQGGCCDCTVLYIVTAIRGENRNGRLYVIVVGYVA